MTCKLLTPGEGPDIGTGILLGVALLLLVFGFSAPLLLSAATPSNPVWFVGLLVVFGAALGLIALAFRWMGLHAPGEAFGLPAGSIRTFLAVGVMVLFAVFGLAAISVDREAMRPAEKALQEKPAVIQGDAQAVQAAIERYRKQHVLAVPVTIRASDAELMLYRMEFEMPTSAEELRKQIVTALVTLLTSVVAFYFGSRSVEAAREAQQTADKRAGVVLPEAVRPDVEKVDRQLVGLRQRLEKLEKAKAIAGSEEALARLSRQATDDLKRVEASRKKLDALNADVAAGRATLEALSSELATLTSSIDTLDARLKQAESQVEKP